MLLRPRSRVFATIVLASAVLFGCQRKIGDGCSVGTDCSQTGDRSCDVSMPGGYCTVPNCLPDKCPSEAGCIAFMVAPSTAAVCSAATDYREMRSFCMRTCSSNEDCRGGYQCEDLGGALDAVSNAWGAMRIDTTNSDGRVCVPPRSADAAKEQSARSDLQLDDMENYCKAGPFDQNVTATYYAVGGASAVAVGSSGAASIDVGAALAGHAGIAGSAGAAGRAGAEAGPGLASHAGNLGVSQAGSSSLGGTLSGSSVAGHAGVDSWHSDAASGASGAANGGPQGSP